jgi:hypothetical protein
MSKIGGLIIMYKSANYKRKVEDNIEYEVENEGKTLNAILRELFGY